MKPHTEEISKEDYMVGVINSISHKYKELRQASKAVTFACTYAGTWLTLHRNLNIPEEEAKDIEQKYHELYKVADDYVKARLTEAQKTGYVICAFGLKLRTPLLNTAILSGRNALKEAKKEARTAGNALGQSWCLLNCRAVNEVMQKVWNSPYRYDIFPCMQIHDASYYYIRDSLDVLTWFNQVLVDAMRWQKDPNIYHDVVKLGGSLELFYPSWAHGKEIPTDADKTTIVKHLEEQHD